MRTPVIRQSFGVLIAAVAFAGHAGEANKTICNFSKPSVFYEQNDDFARVLNQFDNALDLRGQELDDLSKKLVHIAPYNLYHNPRVSRRALFGNIYGYDCEYSGLSTLSFKPGDQYSPSYSFCFITKKGTLDEGEIYVEQNLFLPRKKWISHLDSSRQNGVYRTILRTTRLGTWIGPIKATGFYYLKHGDRYLDVFLSMAVRSDKTIVKMDISDSTEWVKKQIDCEKKL